MSSLIFDAGDKQRLDREEQLTEQAPRALPVEDSSPTEILTEEPAEESSESVEDSLLDSILLALKRRL